MSPFRGRLSGKPLPTNTCVAVVPKAKRKHAWRISFTVELMTDIALDHSPNCHIICGGILLVQFSAVNVSVGSKADKIRCPYRFCFALHSDHIADIA
jgi:hypothetical protein